MKDLKDVDVFGKKVLVRVDFNVPLAEGTVTDDTRIRAALPTIEYLLANDARVILMSHLGCPEGTGFQQELSLAPAVRVLSRLIGRPVALVDDIVGEEAQAATSALAVGDVLMLENLRFDEREKRNDTGFSQELAALADIYVDDAFGAAHRSHASTTGVAGFLPSYAGFLLEREVETLTAMLTEPARPFVAILGGSKVSDKLCVIDRLLDAVDTLIIGGGMCFTFLAAQGLPIGTSLVERDWAETAGKLMAKAQRNGVDLLLPVDIVAADAFSQEANILVCGVDVIPAHMMGLDIGPASCERYREVIATARTVFWNGPMGVFEMKPFENGTKQVARAVAHNKKATTVIGGGDSVAAIKKFGLEDQVTFISTGGGASMKLVEGSSLPGVEVLK